MGSPPGTSGARTSRPGRGAPCGRTTRPTVTPGTSSPTTTPDPAPTAGARTASPRVCDARQGMCLGLALWNGDRSLPEGAAVRAGQRRGQPRRGRQGPLVAPRRGAVQRLAVVAVPLPAGARSRTTSSSRPTGSARSTIPSSSWSTPGCSTTTATGSSTSTTPRPTLDDICMRIRVRNAGPERATLHVLPHLWFRNTWSWGRHEGERPTVGGADSGRRRGARRPPGPAGGVVVDGGDGIGRRADSGCSARTRPTRRVSGADDADADDGLPEGRHQRPRGVRERDGQPRPDRHQGGGLVQPSRSSPAPTPRCGSA